MAKYKIGKYVIYKSPKRGKKYRAEFRDPKTKRMRKVDFGATKYEHYYDRIGLFSHKDHCDLERRRNYRQRHMGIKKKNGRVAAKTPGTPAYFSMKYLWGVAKPVKKRRIRRNKST